MALALAAGLVGAAAERATAAPYEAFIDVETEEDLIDLLVAGQISDETYEALSTLLARGVNLELADRAELYSLPNLTYADVDAILAYRKEQGFIADPAELVSAGVLTEDKLLSVAAFLIVGQRDTGGTPIHGWVRAITRSSPSDFGVDTPVDGDAGVPPLGLRARVKVGSELTVGVVGVSTRLRLGEVVADPNRDALIADPPGLQVVVPKAYARWETDDVDAIVGSFRAGFGQRLTFDNSTDYTPNGFYFDDQLTYDSTLGAACKRSQGELPSSPCTGAAGDAYVTPDFHWRDGLFGVGVGARKITVGEGTLQAYGFGSYSRRSIYQYELVDRGRCADPRDDSDPACSAPDVYARPDGDPLTPTGRYKFMTLPDVFGQALGGGNVTYFADRRNYVGVTGYAAKLTSLVEGVDLDLQEWSALPGGGTFGAAGVNFAFGQQWLDVAGEVAHSFDQQPDAAGPASGGGGPAAILRATATGKKRELEASLRYFSVDHANPFSRPIAAADEFEGNRARDEVGARLRYTGRHGNLGVRGGVDVWTNPSTDAVKAEVFGRVDVQATDRLGWGLTEEYTDKGVRAADGIAADCFEVSIEFDERGEPIPCSGSKLKSIARGRYQVSRGLRLTAQLQHALLDDGNHPDGKRHDLSAWLAALYKPSPDLRVTGRVRYLSEDVADAAALEESLWFTGDVTLRLRKKDRLRVRGDVFTYLDDRASTMDRSPNPELWLWLQYEAKF
ncbi:MAG: hypothetical protein R2939_03830 [Kofleriaceae bacterium]